ncbi:hypothetical protein [Frankia gtarii]|nr:hypothetical protein [Frankia gtarii]
MVGVGLLIRLEAKPGREEDVAKLLTSAVAVVNDEAETPVWLGVRFGLAAFGGPPCRGGPRGTGHLLGSRTSCALGYLKTTDSDTFPL